MFFQTDPGSIPGAAGSLVCVCHEGQHRLALEPRRLGVLQLLKSCQGRPESWDKELRHTLGSSDLSLVLKTQVTDGELDGAVVISDNIHSRFNFKWHRLLTGRRVC